MNQQAIRKLKWETQKFYFEYLMFISQLDCHTLGVHKYLVKINTVHYIQFCYRNKNNRSLVEALRGGN